MICPKCKEFEQKSTLMSGYTTVTAMYCPPYSDDNGLFHNHDFNVRTQTYNCSRGHVITVTSQNSCPSCDFGGKKEVLVRDVGPSSVVNVNNIVGGNSVVNGNSGSLTINTVGE